MDASKEVLRGGDVMSPRKKNVNITAEDAIMVRRVLRHYESLCLKNDWQVSRKNVLPIITQLKDVEVEDEPEARVVLREGM